jgi:hypothetical protein
MYLGMQSPDPKERDHARKLVLSKDHGRAWLRGGWKNEPNADELGRNIGLVETPTGKANAKGESEEDSWFEKGRKGMEAVNEGLAVF